MTPQRAGRWALAWFIAALGTVAARVGMQLLHIDGWVTTLASLGTVCLMLSMYHSGWRRGYRQAKRDVREADA